jgi:hypothetical protein
MHEGNPEAGWFRRRLIPKGPWVPARIWIEPPETDAETGEVTAPERMLCEVDGKRVDVFRAWTWLGQNPISEDQFMDMKAAGFRDLAPDDAPELDVLRDEGPRGPDPMPEEPAQESRPEPGPGKPLF